MWVPEAFGHGLQTLQIMAVISDECDLDDNCWSCIGNESSHQLGFGFTVSVDAVEIGKLIGEIAINEV